MTALALQPGAAAQADLARAAGLFVEASSATAEKLVSMPGPCDPDLQSAARFLADQYGIRMD